MGIGIPGMESVQVSVYIGGVKVGVVRNLTITGEAGETLIAYEDDWSKARSPSRAKRRMKQGIPNRNLRQRRVK